MVITVFFKLLCSLASNTRVISLRWRRFSPDLQLMVLE